MAADLTGSGRLSLFIANDAVPNFFFVNETAETGSTPHFSELGLISGLAMNADGRAEACMGVAAADFNGDGRCDLFVTNFYNESNTLYEQLADGVFRDATRDAGLYDASLKMLGFGTQSIDGDLDGAADLIVTNGHIDDLSDAGTPYQMPAQFFRGDGIGHFSELPAEQLGPYFSRKQLGRGLARLDWNRDGREDVVVSHLDAPAALLTNRTTVAGHFVALQLRGVKSSRDAIGSVVTVRSGAKTWTKQLTAGDGFQCSNERRLVVGLGATETVDELTIRWPSGLVKSFDNLVVDRDFLAIEGAESLVRLKLSEDSGSP